jgi:predicted amidophosphoribosyltransferase
MTGYTERPDTPLDALIAEQTMTPPRRSVQRADDPEQRCPFCRAWIPFIAPERCPDCGAHQ